MKGKCSRGSPAQSGTHLPRETHRPEALAGIYPREWGGGSNVLFKCPSTPRTQVSQEGVFFQKGAQETRLLVGASWWSQLGARGSFPLQDALPHPLPWALTHNGLGEGTGWLGRGRSPSLGLSPQAAHNGHGPLAV